MDALRILLESGADADTIFNTMSGIRSDTLPAGNLEIMDHMVTLATRINYGCPEQSKSSLINLAILKGDVGTLQILLITGAQLNTSNLEIGTPLHVACTGEWLYGNAYWQHCRNANRKKIVQILLKSGADPNIKIYSDEEQIRPALAEYLATNTEPSAEIVVSLLRYGARVIMKTQCRDPDGILNYLKNVSSEDYQHIFYLLLEAAESFDLSMIQRNDDITPTLKEALVHRAKNPISLLAQSRIFLRRYFKTTLVDVVHHIELPETLQQYLLFSSG